MVQQKENEESGVISRIHRVWTTLKSVAITDMQYMEWGGGGGGWGGLLANGKVDPLPEQQPRP